MSAEVIGKDLTAVFDVEDESEMMGTIVRSRFTPTRMEVTYRKPPDRNWIIRTMNITGKNGSAYFGVGNSHRISDSPEWAQIAALTHRPKD